MFKRVFLFCIYIEKYDVVMKKCKKLSVVWFLYFFLFLDDYFYLMLFLLLLYKFENEFVVFYFNFREVFINKR